MINVSGPVLLSGSLRRAQPALPFTRTRQAKRVIGSRSLDLDGRSGDARRTGSAGTARPLD